MTRFLLAIAAGAAIGVGYVLWLSTGWCDDSPTGQHCSCWSERGQGCCFCGFTDGPHALQ